VINRCLRKDPNRRFQTARDLKVALQELLEETDSGTLAAPAGPASSRHTRRWIAAALALSATAAGALWVASAPRDESFPALVESPLTAYEGSETQPAFSPDANQVAFLWQRPGSANTDIYVRLVGAGQPVQLTNTPEPELAPAWSPDGRWLAFLRAASDDATHLLVMPSIGGGERRVASLDPVRASGWSPSRVAVGWAPDSRGVVVTGWLEDRYAAGLLMVDVMTGEKHRITAPPARTFDVGGTFSPDGRQITFIRQGFGNMYGNVYLQDVDSQFRPTGAARALTNDSLQSGVPIWTADGKAVVFQSDRAGPRALWRASVTGGAPVRIALTGGLPADPAIRGSRLAYVQHVADLNIWAIPTSGAGEAVRLVASTRADATPQYSPDGSRIAFCSDQSGNWEIWVARSDGSHQEQLTPFGSGHSCTLRWSPDSRRLVFDSNAEFGQFEVYVISVDGGKPRRLTDDPGTDSIPSFSRDGAWIYFSSTRTGRPEIWTIAAEGGQPVQVTTNGGLAALESLDGQSLYFMREQNGALWGKPLDGGSEFMVLERVALRNFVPAADGIYFMQREAAGHSFRFLAFATGEVRTFGSMTRNTSNVISVSPDARWLAYVQEDQVGSDLILVENFR
jgi:Tol biopolymer transport system component